MDIKIKRIDKTLPLPEYKTPGSCGFDVYSREKREIPPGAIELLPSNLIIQTPVNHVLILVPRSSLVKKKGLVMPNSVGIIDNDYSGNEDEIMLQVKNISDSPVTIVRGERIAQGIFLNFTQATWEETTEMTQDSRGGIGSTGGYKESK